MAARSRQALRYVAANFTAAGDRITGCPGALPLVEALQTGTSLAKAADGQPRSGQVNTQTLAGLNSIGGTVVAQAAELGVTIAPQPPTVAELTAG